jgi:2-polyprenyl-6-methoxyphenol hydroxylase-like FAD-dependent oxidoreductase
MGGMAQSLSTTCCVVGGGPAGLMLGFLLARAGIDTTVLEKHADFLRDFRGDTIHPSTLQAMDDLGLLDEFLTLPHQEARQLSAVVGDETITIADFSHLPGRAKFIALMPQWDFLNFLASKAKLYPCFRLMMKAEVTGLIEEVGVVRGVTVETPDGLGTVSADLTIGADGRHSVVRAKAGLRPENLGAPMDVLWFRLSRRPGDSADTFGRADAGQILVLINRGEHWQAGYIIPKGGFDALKRQGVAVLRQRLTALVPFLADRVAEIKSWDDVKLLTVTVDRLPLWHKPGLLCIGDAAHAMSPVGGVGINVAIQDAIAAANILAPALRKGETPPDALLAAVQKRREPAVKLTQAMQVIVQNRVISNVLRGTGKMKPPWIVRLFNYVPWLRRWPARFVGLGFRMERVRSPKA